MRALALALLAACGGPSDAFQCTDNASCRLGGATGICESTGFCAFADSSCPDGSRYGAAAGSLSNQCVGAGTGSDGGTTGDGPMNVAPHPLGAWANTVAMPTANQRFTFASAQNGATIYVIGGIAGSTRQLDVWFATGNASAILPSGAVSSWTQTTSLPTDRRTFAAAYDGGYVYTFGGRTDTVVNDTSVLAAQVNVDNTLAAWTATTALPQGVRCHAVASSGPNVYVVGGKADTGSQALILRSQMSGGTVSAWQIGATLDVTVFNEAAVVANGYLYVIGGCASGNQVCNQVLDLVEYAQIHPDGTLGTFAHTASLPMPRSHHSAAVSANGDIYVVGGRYGDTLGTPDTADVIAAHPNADGSIGAWHAMTALPHPHGRGGAAVIGSNLVFFDTDAQAATIQ
jgi:N-acetylneuraminic acid mutarotase